MDLAQFHRDLWPSQNGGPAGIFSIAQTPDGLLWLAASDGLWRFDGVQFEHLTDIGAQAGTPFSPSRLLLSRGGDLWVAYMQGAGVARYRGGKLVDMRLPDAPAEITHLVQASDNSIYAEWGGISKRLWRWNGRIWSQVDQRLGLPPGYLLRIISARDGALWAPVLQPNHQATSISRLMPGERRFRLQDVVAGYAQPFPDPAGGVWLSEPAGLRHFNFGGEKFAPSKQIIPLPPGGGLRTVAFDRWGGIWIGSQGAGPIFRAKLLAQRHGLVDSFAWPDPTSSDRTSFIFNDSSGSIWAATDRGLLRFRLNSVRMDTSIAPDAMHGAGLAVTESGTVYAAARGGLYRFASGGGSTRVASVADGAVLCAGPGSTIFLIRNRRLSSFANDHGLKSLGDAPTSAAACAFDKSGGLWFRGLDGSTWYRTRSAFREVADLRAADQGGLLGIVRNRNGEVAVPMDGDTVVVVAGGRKFTYRLRETGAQRVWAVYAGLDGFVALTSSGMVKIAHGRAKLLDAASTPWMRRLTAFAEGANGEVWFMGLGGLSMVRRDDLVRAFDGGGQGVPRRVFDSQDGLAGRGQRLGILGPQAVVGGDNRLFAITSGGIAVVDPARLIRDDRAPKIVYRYLMSGDVVIRDPHSPVLPSGSRSVRIGFSATGARHPERVRITYRLDGPENDWTEAGQRRDVEYSNLGPGKHRVLIKATNEEGHWAQSELNFEISRTFWEGYFFKAICALLLAVGLYIIYRWRVSSISKRVKLGMLERLDERERIARELHDTLLQSVQALLLDFRMVAASLRIGAEGPERLDKAIFRAETVIAEGRDRVHDLRSGDRMSMLDIHLRTIAAQQLGDEVVVVVTSYGQAQELSARASGEIARIATEALFNVAQHASATRVEIVINYLATTLTISFIDDGTGIEANVLKAGRRFGHYGLVGMRERARRLHGELLIDSGATGGTEITLVVPASKAFARKRLVTRDAVRSLQEFWRRRGKRGGAL